MFVLRLLFLIGTCAVFSRCTHIKDVVVPKTTLDLFTQLEPEVSPWWFHRLGDVKPILPGLEQLNVFGSSINSQDCMTLDQCILKRLYSGPMLVLTKDPERMDRLTAYYTEKGLNTIFKDDLYKMVHDYLRTSEPKAAMLINSRKIYNFKMANKPVNKIVIPDDFKLTDLDVLTKIGDKVPLLFITDKDDFDTYKFSYINHFGKFKVLDDGIEPEIK